MMPAVTALLRNNSRSCASLVGVGSGIGCPDRVRPSRRLWSNRQAGPWFPRNRRRIRRVEPVAASTRRLMDRRELLKWSALTAAAAPFLPGPARAQLSAPGLTLSGWESVRQQFRLSEDYVHMSAMLLASHPAPVREAIERHRDGLDADTVAYIIENDERLQNAGRAAAGDYLGVHRSHIALTDSTTMGAGIVYGGLLLRSGDEIVTTDEDYYVTHEATRLAAERAGGEVRSIPLFEELASVTAEQLVKTIVGGVGPATRVLALTWVHSSTGLKLPTAAIGARLADINSEREEGREVLLCV